MTDLPPNSPIDLCAHVLYDKYQRISTEKSYENYKNLCETMGKEGISIEEYESLFNLYLGEDERELPDIRGCILSDVINGKSAKKSIKNLCKAFKHHKIDKEDHAYWYNRFGSGHLFSRITFSNLSDYVIGEIVEICDIKSYLNLRNVSYGLRAIVDQLPPPCPDVIVNGERIVEWDVFQKKNSSLPMEVIEKRVLGVLEPLLRNPKLRLKDFEFYTYSGFWFEGAFLYTDPVIRLLNSLDHKIHTESCSIFAEKPKDLMDILRCFKPGTLELMSISQGFEQNYINEIAQMDQWKQAKHLELRVFGDGLPPMEHFLHFSTIEYFGSITLPDIVNLCDSVSKWTNFEHIQIENQARLDTEEVERALNLQPTASPEIIDTPPNFPIDIRALALYDIHQWKTTEKSYENYEKMCKVLGKEAICYEEYESLFNKYLEESYYAAKDKSSRGLPIPDIRGCILSNAINKKSAEKSFDDLCDAFKQHKIDKEDHDYWFKRFKNGHLFSRVTFSDFPEDVLAEIVGKCDIKSYLNLRNVSFGLRTVIDQLPPPCNAIVVKCGHTGMKFLVNRAVMADSHFLEKANRNQPMEAFEKRIPESLTLLLRNPKLRLKYFTFYASYSDQETHSYIKTVINLLNSLNCKIYVENCSIGVGSTEDLIGILQCFKPGTLEKIYLTGHFAPIDINKIVEMDQWKQAKHLESEDLVLPSIEHLLHFSTVEASVFSSSLEDVIQLCEALSKNPSKAINFESFTLETESVRQMDTAVKSVLNLQPTASSQIYSIPNTNLIIQFESPCWWNWNLQVIKIYKN